MQKRKGRSWQTVRPRRQPSGARHWSCVLASVALGGALLVPADLLNAADIEFTPILSAVEEYSTYVDLDPDGDEQSAWITSLTPGGRLRAEGPRGTLALDGGPTFQYQTDGDDEGWRVLPNVTGLLDAELVENLFFLEGGASVSQQTLNTEESSSSSDQQTVQIYRISPSLRSRLGSEATAELRYILNEVLVSESDVSDETDHIGALTVSGGEDFQRLRWTAGGRSGLQLRSDDGDIMRNDAEIGAEYALTRPVHPIGVVGYQTFHEDGGLDFDSPIWRAGLRLLPNRRLDLAADYGLRDDRYSPAFRLRYEPGPRTNIFASYVEVLGTAQQRLAGTLGFIAIDPETGEFIDDRAGTIFDPRTDPFDIDDDTSRVKLLTALVTHDWRRMTATLGVGLGKEEEVETGDDEDVLSFDVGLQRSLSRQTVLETGFGYIATNFADGQNDDEYFIGGGLRHRLGRSLTAIARYGYRWQDSNEPTDEYKEHRVGVGLLMEF